MTEPKSYALAKKIADYALTKKAVNVAILHLYPVTTMTDFFVICHGESDLQVKAIADAIQLGLKSEGERVWHREGYAHLSWVLLDFVDVVVHVFSREAREFYALERLWGDAKQETVEDA